MVTNILPWRWVKAGKLVEETMMSAMPPFMLAAHWKAEWRHFLISRQARNMKIYNWADLMELSEREVTLAMKGSHHDLVFILIGKKNSLWRSLQMLLWKEAHNKRERGRKKKESLGGLFLQRIIAEVTDNMVHKETANLG